MGKSRSWARPQISAKILAVLAILAVGAVVLSAMAFMRPSTVPSEQVAPLPTFTRTPPAPLPERVPSGEAMARLNDPLRPFTMVILGDSTGADSDSWPTLVSEWISAKYDRPVTVHPWNERTDPPGFTKPRELAQGSNAAITIYNGSAPNRNAAYSLEKLSEMIPVDMSSVDLVLINHGHNQATDTLTPQVHALTTRLSEVAPKAAVMLTLQNPQKEGSAHVVEHATNTGALRSYAERFSFETIDVRQAYLDYGDFGSLWKDDVHPAGAQGYRIWADTVISALSSE